MNWYEMKVGTISTACAATSVWFVCSNNEGYESHAYGAMIRVNRGKPKYAWYLRCNHIDYPDHLICFSNWWPLSCLQCWSCSYWTRGRPQFDTSGLEVQQNAKTKKSRPIRRLEVESSPVSPEGLAAGARLTEDELTEAVRYFVTWAGDVNMAKLRWASLSILHGILYCILHGILHVSSGCFFIVWKGSCLFMFWFLRLWVANCFVCLFNRTLFFWVCVLVYVLPNSQGFWHGFDWTSHACIPNRPANKDLIYS